MPKAKTSSCEKIITIFIAVIVCAWLFNLHRNVYSDHLLSSLKGPLPENDPELLLYIKNEVLQPPSSKPYSLLGKNNSANLHIEESEVFYAQSVRKLFSNKENGFFVEAGALDGETMSNTLWLEQKLGWTGLLVEADDVSYKSLVKKHRKAWSANVCLSPFSYPKKEQFTSKNHRTGPSAFPLGMKTRAMHTLALYKNIGGSDITWYKLVQCIPLCSLLLALDVKTVDLLVLDLEGAEEDVLTSFCFDKFDIQVIFLEWKKEKEKLKNYITGHGYTLFNSSKEDMIFIKNDSPYSAVINKIIMT